MRPERWHVVLHASISLARLTLHSLFPVRHAASISGSEQSELPVAESERMLALNRACPNPPSAERAISAERVMSVSVCEFMLGGKLQNPASLHIGWITRSRSHSEPNDMWYASVSCKVAERSPEQSSGIGEGPR